MTGDGGKVTHNISSDVRNAMDKAKKHIKDSFNVEVEEVCIRYNNLTFSIREKLII